MGSHVAEGWQRPERGRGSSFPNSFDVVLTTLDDYLVRPPRPIRPYVRTAPVDGEVFYNARDVAVAVTERLDFRGTKRLVEAVAAPTADGRRTAVDLENKKGGYHLARSVLKPFLLRLPCPADGVDKRAAVCNHLIAELGLAAAGMIVRRGEVQAAVGPAAGGGAGGGARARGGAAQGPAEHGRGQVRGLEGGVRLGLGEPGGARGGGVPPQEEQGVGARRARVLRGDQPAQAALPLPPPLHVQAALVGRPGGRPGGGDTTAAPAVKVVLLEEELAAKKAELAAQAVALEKEEKELRALRDHMASLRIPDGARGPRNGAPPTRKTSPPLPLPPFYQLTPPAAGRGLYCLTPPPPATVYFAAHAPSPVRPVALFCTHMENEVGKALDMIRSPALEPLRRQRDEETDAQYAARVASALHACACVPAVRTAIQALHMSGVLR
eukprot:jgi/Mesvir1/10191/Mv05733-RA.1